MSAPRLSARSRDRRRAFSAAGPLVKVDPGIWESIPTRELRRRVGCAGVAVAFAGYFPQQPGASEAPVPVHRLHGHRKHGGNLFRSQISEEFHLGDLRFTGVNIGQLRKGLIHNQGVEIHFGGAGEFRGNGSLRGMRISSPEIDENSAHHPRGHGAEMRSIIPGHAPQTDESQIGLVDERSGLQNVPGTFLAEVTVRNPSKLRIDKFHDAIECVVITGHPVVEKTGDLSGRIAQFFFLRQNCSNKNFRER